MSAPRVYLFNAPDDAKHVTTADVALRHSAAASRLLSLALEGMFSEEMNILFTDKDPLVDLAQHAQMWAEKGLEILGQASPAPAVPLGEPVTYGKRTADCPVCGAAVMGGSGQDVTCNRCDTLMHGECYFGRVATLAEWQEYIRNVNGGPEDFAPSVVCAQCRAKGVQALPSVVVPLRPNGA